jgi:bifunctional DNA-binding transcriptional regulator/antitoxin component of YhaV-PrlF toxin-antitoxin module
MLADIDDTHDSVAGFSCSAGSPLPADARVEGVSVISRKNQVTLPVEAMRAAGLRRGDDLRIEVRGPGRLELIRTDDPRRGVRRRLRRGRLPGRYLDELRREWP